MKKEKQIQIPLSLFMLVFKYFIGDIRDPETEHLIRVGLSQKVNAINRHEIYSKYKSSSSPEEQENARQAYLDAAGIPDSFRWPEEMQP